MTEEEAKTKWCPMVRVAKRDGKNISSAYNKLFGTWRTDDSTQRDDLCSCLASKCMMWTGKKCGLTG